MKLLMRWAVLAFSMWVATTLISGIKIDGGFFTYFWVAMVFGLVNAFIGTIVKILTIPISLVTFGLFIFVVNAAMLKITDAWSSKLEITNFWSAIWSAVIIAIITGLFKKFDSKVKLQ